MNGRPDVPDRHAPDPARPGTAHRRTDAVPPSQTSDAPRPRHAPVAGTGTPARAPARDAHFGRHAVPARRAEPTPPPVPVPVEITVPGHRRWRLPAGADAPTGPLAAVTAQREEPEFAAARGQLPLPESGEEPGGDAAARRIKVTLTPPTPERPTDPGRATYSPSVPDGLGKFDLGSVPASVTPPTTWRRAAWFAGLSSTAVVVALLAAGTLLVGGTDEQSRAVEGRPDRTGRLALPPEQGSPADARNGDDLAVPDTAAADESATTEDRRAALRAAHTTDTAPAADSRSGADDGGPTTSRAPSKPPVTPAATSTAPRILWTPHDTKTLAQRSQDYFNLVTENPSAAHDLTTGELAELGPDGLAERYADVAYFEVREVYIDADEGRTRNTVRVTYPDGSTAEETRTLKFGEGDRIAAESG